MSGDSANPDSGGPVVDRDHDSDLDVMVPEGQAVQVGGETIMVTPLTIGQLAPFVRCLRRTNINLAGDEIDLEALIVENGDAVIEAVAIAVKRSVDSIQALELDAFIMLATAVIEVNNDFFVQRLAPRMEQALKVIEKTFSHNSFANSLAPGTHRIQ